MTFSKKIISWLLLVALVGAMCGCTDIRGDTTLPSGVFPEMHEEIDYTLHGVWITQDGEVQEMLDFSVTGTLDLTQTGEDTLALDFLFPDAFPYAYDSATAYTSQSRKYFDLPYCVICGYSFNNFANKHVFSYFALCPAKEYVIFYWEDDPQRFLVASTDPNATPHEILAYFDAFIEKYIDNAK